MLVATVLRRGISELGEATAAEKHQRARHGDVHLQGRARPALHGLTRKREEGFPRNIGRTGDGEGLAARAGVPYRLPELLAAPRAKRYGSAKGEGRRQCRRARPHRDDNPGGAGKWRPELAPWFKDKQLVYVLEDNDDAGRAHAAKVVAALRNIVATIAVVPFRNCRQRRHLRLARGWWNRQALLAGGRSTQAWRSNRGYDLVAPRT